MREMYDLNSSWSLVHTLSTIGHKTTLIARHKYNVFKDIHYSLFYCEELEANVVHFFSKEYVISIGLQPL